MQKIKVGIVGYGMAAQIFHLPFLSINDGFEISKILQRNSDTAREKYPNSSVVRTLEELTTQDVDLVVITTPNEFHYEQAKFFLERGKHVIVEKPFTVKMEEARELTNIADKNKLTLSIHHNRRWDGPYKTVKKIIESGVLGKLREYEAHFDRFRNTVRDKWKEKNNPGSGILYDLGSHLIDQSLILFGEPDYIFCDLRKQRINSESDDYFELNMFYDNLKVTLKAGMLVNYKSPHYILTGTNGNYIKYGFDVQESLLNSGEIPMCENWGFESEENYGILSVTDNEKNVSEKIKTETGSYQDYYKNIYDHIIYGKELEVKPQQIQKVIEIIEKSIISSNEKKIIQIKK